VTIRRIGGPPAITLFHASDCEQCWLVRRQLAAAGLRYDAREVPHQRELRGELEALTGQLEVPALLLDGEPVVGMGRVMSVLAALPDGGDDVRRIA
jgi:glutaredoxin